MTPKYQTNFAPNYHGFHFRNSFPGAGVIQCGTLRINLETIGLCGGMCFSALDYAYEKKPIPDNTVPPEKGPLYKYIFNRQLDSWGHPFYAVIRKIVEWQLSPDIGGPGDIYSLKFRTRNEWRAIKSSLDAGLPVTLMLIREEGAAPSKNNHQVLAIGYKMEASSNKGVIIYVYDPNKPDNIGEIGFNLKGNLLAAWDSSGSILRGFFPVPYDREQTEIIATAESSFIVPIITYLL